MQPIFQTPWSALYPNDQTDSTDCKSRDQTWVVADCAGNTATYANQEVIYDDTNPILKWIDNDGDETS